jgi:hypothetical protein
MGTCAELRNSYAIVAEVERCLTSAELSKAYLGVKVFTWRVHFDIPWCSASDWSAEAVRVAEKIHRVACPGRPREDYQYGLDLIGDSVQELWSELMFFASYCYEMSFFNFYNTELGCITDDALSAVIELTPEQARKLGQIIYPLRLEILLPKYRISRAVERFFRKFHRYDGDE